MCQFWERPHRPRADGAVLLHYQAAPPTPTPAAASAEGGCRCLRQATELFFRVCRLAVSEEKLAAGGIPFMRLCSAKGSGCPAGSLAELSLGTSAGIGPVVAKSRPAGSEVSPQSHFMITRTSAGKHQEVAAHNADFFFGRPATAWFRHRLFRLLGRIPTQTGEKCNSG